MERNLWRREFLQDDVPLFPCPRCNRGPIYMDRETLHSEESTYSVNTQHEDWEPDWIKERFVVLFRCHVPACGEIVAVSGERQYGEVAMFKGGEVLRGAELLLRPHSMFPAPPIISLPRGLPPSVGRQLDLAFEFFWVDFGASANRLRISLESLLDEFKIVREKEKGGKKHRLSLHERIGEFEEVDKEHAETFHALRIVGNVGAHDNVETQESLLDAFEIYEPALAQLYAKERIESIRKKIIDTKGKY